MNEPRIKYFKIMRKKENNYAYIDGANLHKGIVGFGWTLDYVRFRIWLSEKYGVRNAYIFIGLIPKYNKLYTHENKFDSAVLVSSDGDYAGLVKFLKERGKLKVVLSPHTKDKCSILLKRTDASITYLNDVRSFLEKS